MLGYRAGLMAGGAALLLMLGACGKKPGGQVVAVVNGQEITQQELNVEAQGAHVPAGVDQKKVLPLLLQRVVERKLVAQLAQKDGLDKTPGYLDQVRVLQDNLLANLYAQKIAKTIALPDAASVDAFIQAHPTIFAQRTRYVLDQLVFVPTNAGVIQQLVPAHSLDAIAAVLTAANVPFARGVGNLDTASIPPQIASKIASLPPGEPFLLPDNGRVVASVIKSSQAAPVSPADARPAAVNLIRQQALQEAVGKQVAAARADAKIAYEKGFAPPPTQPAASPAAP